MPRLLHILLAGLLVAPVLPAIAQAAAMLQTL